ncbi:MAG: molybdopterin molybdotransferase MoeA, partial [Synergistaceae bacterium]|nr:molybdopterin molybdotransferase MoeA [Synergistaceae bacterium]
MLLLPARGAGTPDVFVGVRSMNPPTRTLEDAVKMLLGRTPVPEGVETVFLLEALERVIRDDCFARFDLPPFDRSPLDGYAVRHEDLVAAGPLNPAVLTVTQHIYAGDVPETPIFPGEAAQVATGAPLPPGATCVVALEDTDCGKKRVEVYVSLEKHQNYVFRGEDFFAGHLVIERGTRIKSTHVGLLAGQGIKEVRVYPRPKVGLFPIGSELAPAGTSLSGGMIYDSNGPALAARIRELGGEPRVQQNVADDLASIVKVLEGLLKDCDFVVTTGGVSVGERDYMHQVAELLGGEILFYRLDYKPGGVTLALLKNGKPILCLPGSPFAAFMSFELLAGPVLKKLAGLKKVQFDRISVVLKERFPKPSPHRRFVRGQLRGGEVFLGAGMKAGSRASGSFSSWVRGNCLI